MTNEQIKHLNALWQLINKLSPNDKDFVRSLAPSMELNVNKARRLEKLAEKYLKEA